MKKKKILIVSFLAYPLFKSESDAVHGGSELAMYTVARHLSKQDFDVHFIVGDFSQPEFETVDEVHLHKGQKVQNTGLCSNIKNFIGLFRMIRKINPDIIVSSSAGWLTVELIAIKSFLGKKYVFRSSHQKNINGFTDTKSYGWLYRKLINRIDCFILQNIEDRETLKKNFNYLGKIVRIPNLQSIPEGKPWDFSRRKHILWVGRSEKIKKPELFLEIARRVPERNFLMIMPKTNPAIFHAINESATGIGNLEIIPGIKRKNIMRFYEEALYLVSTSEGEGFPNVLVEAMKCGTPIISSLDYDNFIKKENCGFVAEKSQEISKIINETKQENWNIQSINCYSFAKNNFDIRQGIKKYEDIMKKL